MLKKTCRDTLATSPAVRWRVAIGSARTASATCDVACVCDVISYEQSSSMGPRVMIQVIPELNKSLYV